MISVSNYNGFQEVPYFLGIHIIKLDIQETTSQYGDKPECAWMPEQLPWIIKKT